MTDGLPDSGSRREFATGSVRDNAGGKGRFDLLPFFATFRQARHMERGARKYGARNWEKGQPASVYADAANRHLAKYLGGLQDEDHLEAARWNLMALSELEARCLRGELPAELLDLPIHGSEDEKGGPHLQRLASDLERVGAFLRD